MVIDNGLHPPFSFEARMRLPPQLRQPDPLDQLLKRSVYQAIPITLVQHGQAVPLGVLVRGTLEWMLDEPTLEKLFHEHAPEQYTRELTIDALVRLLIQVSAGTRASVYAAYQADQALDQPSIGTSYQAVYGKIGRLNPAVSAAVVRHSAACCGQLLALMPRARVEPLPAYRMRVLDGTVLAGTHHRLTPLRQWLNACLPGKSLVVYEPGLGLVTDVVLCEDAYTQERLLLTEILPRVHANDLFVADRNFCTTRFVFGIAWQQAFVLVRQHRRNLPCQPLAKLKCAGQTNTGTVYEQRVQVTDAASGKQLNLRRIEIRLLQKTRDGDRTIAVLTNLPDEVSAQVIAAVYLMRWTIETHLQLLTQSLHCELPGLGKPRAALFGFAMALVAGNALAVVRGSIRSAHGVALEAEVSGHYLADEIAHDYRTLMKYLPAEQWVGWRRLPTVAIAQLLRTVATHVNLKALIRSPRGPKKPRQQKPVYNKQHKHYSTARLLKGLEQEDSC
jgi:Transposase DDE domain